MGCICVRPGVYAPGMALLLVLALVASDGCRMCMFASEGFVAVLRDGCESTESAD